MLADRSRWLQTTGAQWAASQAMDARDLLQRAKGGRPGDGATIGDCLRPAGALPRGARVHP